MWFDSWMEIGRIALVGAGAYFSLIVVLRLAGKRALSQLNAFDFIVTVALGSTLSTILLDSTTSWSEGLAAFALLAGLQFLVARTSSRRPTAKSLFTGPPVVLFSQGSMRHDTLRKARLAESDVLQEVRQAGTGEMALVAAVILEPNGRFSVIPTSTHGDGSALTDVQGR